ncbi:unnamed protein product [Paramecium primaurelia]|uniref:Uncharacterized protein n=1 Tax=Paramecium primaurelia TaxID=5886 RepID=A0A8S1NZV5_PARPR|nr:unnamed protein product [Paramecium primaurelia]
MSNFFYNPSDKYIRLQPYKQSEVPFTTKCEKKSFHQKRKFLYRILIEISKLTENRGILQLNTQTLTKKVVFFQNVDEFFEQILSSTFQKYIVDAVIELSQKIKYSPTITDDDKKEFIKGLKISEAQTMSSLCKQKKKKAQNKLRGILEQQVNNETQNNLNDIENQIQESITNIIENLQEIFTKEQ